MKNIVPITFTIIFLIGAIALGYLLDEQKVSAYGSIIAASGSVIAIIWFTIGLKRDTEQQKIQNKQFGNSFNKLIEQGRRESLVIAKSILDDTESKIINSDKEKVLQNVFQDFLKPFDYQTLYNSDDAKTVLALSEEWVERMGPGYQIMRSIKSAASIYLKSINADDIDHNKAPEEFVYIYGSHFWNEPFFDNYRVIGEMLSQFQYMIQPGTKGITIAALCAQSIERGLPINKEKIKEDLEKLLLEKKDIPRISYSIFPEFDK